MKIFIKAAALFIVAISFAACQKAENPVAPSAFGKSTIRSSTSVQRGTFEILYPGTASTARPETISGTIIISFDYAESTYKYEGWLNSPTIDKYSNRLQGSGKFEKNGNNISLNNNPVIQTTSEQYYLIFDGTYQYSERGDQTIIEGETNLGYIRILLN